ncbi:DJ-1/PfpI family protein [Sinosporangium album]|uniref:DJ-1/PfpI family protein n=1 Tax=Sinosporangium album TaxID=504805 RepID=A0A1G7U1H5_9ACTN|nr:DJ-1/PfpI family protein [Sinosporangium album]SDG40899.1 DJ-1/PfpI family protein [Sinosporangium album]
MHIAIPLFPAFTALDVVGPYTGLAFAPGFTTTFVSDRPGPVTDDQGALTLTATASYDEVPRPDIIIVPGGPGTTDALSDDGLLNWIKRAHEHTAWTTSVCTGSLLLGAAGALRGLRATTHWSLLEQLEHYGARPCEERVVIEGKVATAAGVSAGLDMALTLLARIRGEDTAQLVQLVIEYDPEPPFRAGSTKTAPPELVERARELLSS